MSLTSDGAGGNTDTLKTLPQICQQRNFPSALNQATDSSPREAAASGQRAGGEGRRILDIGRVQRCPGGGRGDAAGVTVTHPGEAGAVLPRILD